VLRNGQETAQKHFDQAKKIMKNLDEGRSTTARSEKSTGTD
jgi:hypothetical protein